MCDQCVMSVISVMSVTGVLSLCVCVCVCARVRVCVCDKCVSVCFVGVLCALCVCAHARARVCVFMRACVCIRVVYAMLYFCA